MGPLLVSICCLAYNHEHYIRQCLDSFLMQKTDFSFEVLIHDDASTDNTAEIIREYEKNYPDIIKPIYQIENQFSKGVGVTMVFQFPRAKGKYIAMCEGDDYWNDQNKLQKQVDFLEANSEYVMISGNVCLVDERNNSIPANEMMQKQENRYTNEPTFFDLLQLNLINTPTVCARADIFKSLVLDFKKRRLWYTYDYWYWLNIVIHYKIKVSKETLASYRINSQGVSRNKGYFEKRKSWVILDSIKRYAKEKKVALAKEKIIIFDSMFGLLLNSNNSFKLRLDALAWILLHPSYIFQFLTNKEKYNK